MSVLLLGATLPGTGQAQIAADASWSVITTPHFRVHFTPDLDSLARHAAYEAERAYANLASELVRPRGKINLVVTNAVDASNGSATVFPRNRIVVHARPPADVNSLAGYSDWMRLVIQHELAHIFHLDRTRGIWRFGQYLLGRHPALFPNAYSPSWLKEGVAIYYESRFTDGGRLDNGYQYALARAAARHDALPPLDALSLARSEYPGGSAAYVYGSFLVNELAERHSPASMRKLVEQGSGQLLPIYLNHLASKSFDESFSRAWARWRDSVTSETSPIAWPSATWRVLASSYQSLYAPRWLNDSTILVAGDNGTETQALFHVTTAGTVTRVGRRNGLGANAPGPDGTLVFAQLEYQDRFRVTSDLYLTKNGHTRRLTRGQRLSAPDVRADGEIVAVQTIPGGTRLVRVSRDGLQVYPLLQPTPGQDWTTPRWSPDGSAIVAHRQMGGKHEVVIMTARGSDAFVVGETSFNEVIRSVAWAPAGDGVYIVLSQDGVSRVYFSPRDKESAKFTLVQTPNASLDIVGLDARTSALGGRTQLVTTYLDGDGYGIAYWTPEMHHGAEARAQTSVRVSQHRLSTVPGDTVTDRYRHARASSYRPWRSLLPSYWSPILDASGTEGTLVGAVTSGSDVIGRHSYVIQGWLNTRDKRISGLATYQYGRFAHAILDVTAEQSWSYSSVYSQDEYVGNLDERIQRLSAHITFPRTRMRTYAALIIGAEHEVHDYVVTPDSLGPLLDNFYLTSHRYPAVMGSLQFSTVQRPTLSISPEDGIAISGTARQRWTGASSTSKSLSGVLSLYKSLNAFGFAHHVIAVRIAGAMADAYTPSRYSVGGVSGGALTLFPGVSIGDQARMFPIRGFGPSVQQGTRAYAGSFEYRAPFVTIGRGLGLWPVFVDRTSVSFFADGGRAYCHTATAVVCRPRNFGTVALLSAGVELNVDMALQYDAPYRIRLGVAAPVRGGATVGQTSSRVYLTIGSFF